MWVPDAQLLKPPLPWRAPSALPEGRMPEWGPRGPWGFLLRGAWDVRGLGHTPGGGSQVPLQTPNSWRERERK